VGAGVGKQMAGMGRDGQILNVVAEAAVGVAEMAEAIRSAVGAQSVAFWLADARALDQSVDGSRARRVSAWTRHI
jgi:hypothetical protein